MFLRNALMAGGDKARKSSLKKTIMVWTAITVVLHGAAYFFLSMSDGKPSMPHALLILVSGAMLVALTLMLSTGLRASVEALFERGDMDLLLSSPLPSRSIFTVRLAGIVIGSSVAYLFFLAPVAHMGALLGQWRWLAIYPTLICMAAVTSSLAMLLTLALVRWLGVRRTRVVAQVLGAVSGASLYLLTQAGNLGGFTAGMVERVKPLLEPGQLLGPDSWLWLPARAALGSPLALLWMTALVALSFALTVRFTHGFFVRGVQQAASASVARKAPPGGVRYQFGRSLTATILIKEWRLIARDPQLISQVLLQLLYMLPLLVLMFTGKVPSVAGMGAGLTFLCATLTASLAWIVIAAEDAPDLLRAAPCNADTVKVAKLLAAVLPPLALVVLPLAWMGMRAPLAALTILLMAAIASANSALVVKWCSRPAARGDFKMRGKGNVMSSVFELLGGLFWSASAFALLMAIVLTGRTWMFLLGAGAAALVAMVILGLARHFRPDGD